MRQDRQIGLVALLFALLVPVVAISSTNYPAWWLSHNVINTNLVANDFAPATAGQLKWMATKAYDELQTNLPGGAGTGVASLVSAFSTSNNYVPINLGQLKYVSEPFYACLNEQGITTAVPWTATLTDDADFAPANVGQMKHVFSFDLDMDADSLPDWWEIQWFGCVTNWGGGDDPDGDGLSNLQEYHQLLSPTNRDTDNDGLADGADGIIPTNSYSGGADQDEDGYVDGELDYGTDPYDYDTDGDGLVDGVDGLISTNSYRWGVDRNTNTYVDGELDFATAPLCFDTDGDGTDDGLEVFLGSNPTNALPTTGINRNWLFHNSADYSSPTWELIPGIWQRFLMVDYESGTNAVYFLLPTNVVLDAGGTLDVECRFTWCSGTEWPYTYLQAYFFTSTVVSADAPFHGLPTMGSYTLNVYRVDWAQPPAITSTVYYCPLIKTLSNGVETEYLYLASKLLTNDIGVNGYGSNNWRFGTQFYSKDYFNRDYSFSHVATRFRNGGFEDGSPTSYTNLPYWVSFEDEGELSTTITHGSSGRSFVSKGKAGLYQNIAVYPGEELVIEGYMFTPSTNNIYDPNPITEDRYGLLAVEYLDMPGIAAMAIDRAKFYSTNTQNQWHCFAITSLVPNGAKSANISVRTVSPRMDVGGVGNVYFDDISVSVSLDTDRDGMPDWWETEHSPSLSSTNPVDSVQDADGDQLLNIEEYRFGTDPLSLDTDGDGMSDPWEIYYGFNPRDTSDADDDADGDGLSNVEEFQAETDPWNPDSDGDGLADGLELKDHHSDPRNNDFQGFVVVQEIHGADISGSLGNWTVDGSDVYASGRRGYVEYSLNLATSDLCRIKVVGCDNSSNQCASELELRISVDGAFLDRLSLVSVNGSDGSVACYLPWLSNGVHTLQLYWDNIAEEKALRIRHIYVESAPGADADADGLNDWVENRLTRLSGVDVAPTSSVVSPICLEGRDPYISMMTISTGALQHGAGDLWYADISLPTSGSAVVKTAFQNGALVVTNSISWAPLNMLSASNITIRTGDALLLTAITNGATSGSVSVQVVGVTSYVTGVSSPVPHQFLLPGTSVVSGTYVPITGPSLNGMITVTVCSATFSTNPACWMNVPRYWVCSNLTAGISIAHDVKLAMVETNSPSGGGRAFLLMASDPERRYIVARVSPSGAILTNVYAEGFRLGVSAESGVTVKDVCGTGDQLLETVMVLSPVFSGAQLHGEIIVGGILFENGDLFHEWTSSDFNALGECPVRFIRASSSQTSFCNIMDVYQGGDYIGRFSKDAQ